MTDDERIRAAQAARYLAGDILADRVFTDTIDLARYLFQASFSAITLIDDSRHWFAATLGLDVSGSVEREHTMCNSAILSSNPMIVLDATLDPVWRDNRYVTGDPYIRFYAGIPLCSPLGARIGTLCVADQRERAAVDAQHVAYLTMLATLTMDRLHARMLAHEAMLAVQTLATQAVDLCDRAATVDALAARFDARAIDDALHADATAQGVRQLMVVADEIEEHVSAVVPARSDAIDGTPAIHADWRAIEDDFALQRALVSASNTDLDDLVDRSVATRAAGETLKVQSRYLLERSTRLCKIADGYLTPLSAAESIDTAA